MSHVTNEIHIERSPDDVWAVTGDFAGLDTWMPGITRCDMVADGIRDVYMGDILTAKEQLVERDEESRVLAYSIIGGGLPIEEHVSRITVVVDGNGSKVTWAVDATPDKYAAILGGAYAGALDALKSQLEGQSG